MRKALIPAVLLVLGSMVLGATVLRDPIARAAVPITSVFITNDASHAVPVASQGTANTREQNTDANGNIKVHEQGTANVSISGTPTVNIANATQQVSVYAFAEPGFSGSNECSSTVYTVAAGKQLVIETLAAQSGGFPTTTSVSGQFFGEDSTHQDIMPLVWQPEGDHIFSASEAVHYTFPAGITIAFNGEEFGSTGCSFAVALGGYLQPAP